MGIFANLLVTGKPANSDWATSHGLTGIETKIAAGIPLTQAEMNLLQGANTQVGSSIAPSGFTAGVSAGNQSAIWNDFVARVQDAESGGNSLTELITGYLITGGLAGGATGTSVVTAVATGQDPNIPQALAVDAGGLVAGVGLSYALPAFGLSETAAVTEISTTEAVTGGAGEVAASGIDFGAEGVGWSATTATGATTALSSGAASAAGSATGSFLSGLQNIGTRLVQQQLPALLQRIGIGGRTAQQPRFLPQENAGYGLGSSIYGDEGAQGPSGINMWLIAAALLIFLLMFGAILRR